MSKIYCTKIYHTNANGQPTMMLSPDEYMPVGQEHEFNHKWDLEHIEFKQEQSDSRHYHVITLWSRDDKKVTEEITQALKKNFPLPSNERLDMLTSPLMLKKRVKDSQDALARGLPAILKPGVKLDLPDFIPQFSVDPNDPNTIVKSVDGKEIRGSIVDGTFVPYSRQAKKKAVSKKKLTKR